MSKEMLNVLLNKSEEEKKADSDYYKKKRFSFLYDNMMNEYKILEQRKIGRVLTIIDAVIQSEKQAKYVKDLIRSAFQVEVDQMEGDLGVYGALSEFIRFNFNDELKDFEENTTEIII